MIDMTPRTFTISAHSLGIYDRCSRAYLHYKVHGRKAVRSAAGLIAGTALHEGVGMLHAGGSIQAQESAIDTVIAQTPTPLDDYRTAAYLRDALAAFRAEFSELFKGWTVEEQETQGTVELGTVDVMNDPEIAPYTRSVQVFWEFRRDLVARDPEGRRWIIDYKTSSRNEDAQYLAFKNSGQFMGYLWSWNRLNPERLALGVLPIRIILRRPSRTGVAYEFPHDPPILFPPERLDEWRRHTLRKVRTLLERDPADPEDWPLASAELGLCRHTYGVCEFLAVCTLKPGEDRMRMLQSDAYEDADAGKAPAQTP